jgi:hypothetical protein
MEAYIPKLMIKSKLVNVLYFLHQNNFLFTESPQISIIGEITQYFTSIAWFFVQTLIGFDESVHVDLERLSVLASHDAGGTSV